MAADDASKDWLADARGRCAWAKAREAEYDPQQPVSVQRYNAAANMVKAFAHADLPRAVNALDAADALVETVRVMLAACYPCAGKGAVAADFNFDEEDPPPACYCTPVRKALATYEERRRG